MAPLRRSRLPEPQGASFGRQSLVLARRFGRVLGADKLNLALLILQPVVIAGLICLVCKNLPLIFFLLVVSALWFGCGNAAQQVVKERTVYRRERMVNLRLTLTS